MLPRGYRFAFEFRHKSWYDDDIFDLLHEHDIALCLSDHHDAPSPWQVTARHVYVRGHGPGGRYKDHYSDRTLRAWRAPSRRGGVSGGRSSSISTTIKKAPPPRTRAG
jgi:uncharacterized protein YecE (DUF72 family)